MHKQGRLVAAGYLILGCCVVVASMIGCGPDGSLGTSSRGSGAVAVIDLDAVAKELGRDRQIEEALKQREASLANQLTTMNANYQQQIDEKARAMGAANHPQVTTMKQTASQNLVKAKQQAQDNFEQYKQELVGRFREEVRPVAGNVAESRGLTVTVTKNDTVYDFSPGVDITAEVIQRLRQSTSVANRPTDVQATPAYIPR